MAFGRAYRHGDVVCELIAVSRYDDQRVGLAPAERQHATVRFLEPPVGSLGEDVVTLMRTRGVAARRAAERLEPVELVLDGADGPRRAAGRLEPPAVRFGALRDVEFGIRVWP